MKPFHIMMAVLVILIFIFIVIILSLLVKQQETNFKRDVRYLFGSSENISDLNFGYNQLVGLPDPVQRYFKYALDDGQAYVSYIRLQHDGQFKSAPDKDWMDIKGQQYFTVANPGFIWKATTSFFTADDRYINHWGNFTVKWLSLFKIIDGKGPRFDEAGIQRWLAENFWFPTNLLPSDHLRWESIDDLSAKLIYNHGDLTFSMIVRFNEMGELVSVECKRYMEGNLQTWKVYASEYDECQGMMIPTMIEAVWALESGDYSYAKFEITRIEYDKPAPF